MPEVYPVILFYKYVPIESPVDFANGQRQLCTTLGLKGRVLIASEGINGTLAGPAISIESYVTTLQTDPRFRDIEIKFSSGDGHTFPKLAVKVRPEIVALNAGIDLTADQDNHLQPFEWKRIIEEERDFVMLDVRNGYESAAGKFEGAVTCEIEHFRELPNYVERLGDLKDRKVLMYCTGGIRCEKASALLRSKGFKNVFQLHGGIMKYLDDVGTDHWLGECFVFDQRMTVRAAGEVPQIGRCAHTGRETTRFINCLHDPCHKLLLVSEEAEREQPDYRLCPECLNAGLMSHTAEYKRPASEA